MVTYVTTEELSYQKRFGELVKESAGETYQCSPYFLDEPGLTAHGYPHHVKWEMAVCLITAHAFCPQLVDDVVSGRRVTNGANHLASILGLSIDSVKDLMQSPFVRESQKAIPAAEDKDEVDVFQSNIREIRERLSLRLAARSSGNSLA